MTDVLFQSATETAARLRSGQLSARELTEQVLARVEAINPTLNAIVETDREAALRAADEADRTGPRSELHGLPMTIKESFQVAGLHSTWGEPAFAGNVATQDAVVVQRLRAAGVILFGTTNVATMLADTTQSANAIYGRTVNPWAPARSPGGSTGGGAAALAAGLSFLEYGSDLAGSIRIPAALCGVYGLKPTASTVPTAGFQPPGVPSGPSHMAYLSSVGPLAGPPPTSAPRCAPPLARTAPKPTPTPGSSPQHAIPALPTSGSASYSTTPPPRSPPKWAPPSPTPSTP